MHAGRLALAVLAVTAAAGCLGVDNMTEFKTELGAHEVPDPPTGDFDASAASVLPGEVVTFTAAPSDDPLGQGLDHAWSFGDGGQAQGRQVTHRYQDPGTYTVRLEVTDARGRTDTATTDVRVGVPNRPPRADVEANTPSGDPVDQVQVGENVVLSAEGSTDPDDDPLTYDWTLGDGTTADEATVTHVYQTPGLYPVSVTVADPDGETDEATVDVPVTLDRTWEDTLSTPNNTAAHPVPVAEGARITANLSFPAGPLGGNDLDLAVVDAEGETVASSNTTTPVGADGTQYEEVVVNPDRVADRGPGAWTAEVQRVSGAEVDYTLRVTEAFPAAE